MSDLNERAVDFEGKYGWSPDYCYDITTNIEPTKDQDIINWLRSENAYLKGKIEAYEKFLKKKGYIKEKE